MNNNWRNNLKENYPIDALDGDNTWYEAFISDIIKNNDEENSYIVRYMGWSEKWNIIINKHDHRIAPRNSKVPNWRKLIKIGYFLEYRAQYSKDNSTWSNGICVSINEINMIKILSSSRENEGKYVDIHINSPDLAEPYTHCGYSLDVTSSLRNLFLSKIREIYKLELDMLYKTQYWQCIPFLPELEIELVKKTISKVRFDNQEMERNKRKDIYIKN